MRTPSRKRAMRRSLLPPTPGVDLRALASKLSYIGSPEHKSRPSFAGQTPKLRSDVVRGEACESRSGPVQGLSG